MTAASSIMENLAAAVKWIASGRIDTKGHCKTALPRQAQQVYDDLLHQRVDALSVIFDWSGSA